MTVFIRENAWIARVAAWVLGQSKVAVVIGKNIYLWNANKAEFLDNPRWVRHEFVHVLQFRRYGLLWFSCLYLWEWMKKGYSNNKYENEARLLENDGYLLRQVQFN